MLHVKSLVVNWCHRSGGYFSDVPHCAVPMSVSEPFCLYSILRSLWIAAAAWPFPINFEANRGQVSTEYPYIFHRDGLLALFERNGVDFALAGADTRDGSIHLRFLGAHAAPDALEPQPGHSNYFLGHNPSEWIRNVPLYSQIEYNSLYPGTLWTSTAMARNSNTIFTSIRIEPIQNCVPAQWGLANAAIAGRGT